MAPKTSAYLSVFDDWQLLGAAIASIAPRVDEIVVVDGAYRWMAPFLQAVGRDPSQSDPRVREALAPFESKLRWINQLWDNEMHKRAAGYAACSHRYIYRVDADEVLFFDEAALERCFAGAAAVAEMAMPIVVAPGLIRGEPGHRVERQGLLFDRGQISPVEHLAYLWLVLTPEERAQVGSPEPGRVFAEPIAFNAHLTHWRPPDSAVARARFYVLNYLRQGAPVHLAPGFNYTEAAGFDGFLRAVPAETLTQYLMGHAIVAGAPKLEGRQLIASPLTPNQEAAYSSLYTRYLDSLAALNADLSRRPRAVARGDFVHIDLSTPAAIAPFERDGLLHLVFSNAVAAAKVELMVLHPAAPWETVTPLPHGVAGGTVSFALPGHGAAVRLTLRIAVWTHADDIFLTMAAPA